MKSKLFLNDRLESLWRGNEIYRQLELLQGDIYRHKEGRKTMRFTVAEDHYFLKLHTGIGWKEILKNLFSFRLPVISAKNEWEAIHFLEKYGLETMTLAGYGEKGISPASKHSFVITEALNNTISLEKLGEQWKRTPPAFNTKKNLIEKIAQIAATMHRNGMNHRDFYLCHFLLDEQFATSNTFTPDMPLFLIDLHRAQIRQKTPQRWVVKDLGSLYFSAFDVPLNRSDLFRFIRAYRQQPLKKFFQCERQFWQQVQQRAEALYGK